MKFIIIFSIASIINVMLNTIKTIVMYDKNKLSSSLINAVTYGFYTVIVVMMAGEMPLVTKIVVTAVTNFIGVWWSMVILAKFEKDKLWEVRTTVRSSVAENVACALHDINISYSTIETIDGSHVIFNIYCPTQNDSLAIKQILKKFNAKYFVSESKTL